MDYTMMLARFRDLASKIEYCKYTLNGVIYWDKVTYMPKNGIGYRSEVMSFLADMQYRILTSEEFTRCVDYFDGNPNNDFLVDAMVRRIRESSMEVKKIPEKEYSDYIKLVAVSEQVWEEARNQADYDRFEPYFRKIIEAFKKFAGYWGYENEPYDALMGSYITGLTCRDVDYMIENIKAPLFELVEKRLKSQEKMKKPAKISGVSEDRQSKLWHLLLEEIGFDFDCGRVDVGAQTTVLTSSSDDVRILNYYSEDDITVGIFNVLHSGGKGVYQQHISKSLKGTLLGETPSFAMDEAVGRFYENIIGRSKAFWSRIFPKACEIVPELLDIGLDNFYNSINMCSRDAIRISADELTYLIHVIIRYEIERALINGDADTSQVRDMWDCKYKEYLGIVPKNDAEGVLQDIHWSGGYVGYFPTYITANIAAAQFAKAIEKEMGSLDELILNEGLSGISEWMSRNIYRWGASFNTFELIERACGEELKPGYYIEYLTKKFS